MMPSSEFYKQRELQFKHEGERIEKKIRQYSWSRVALVLVMGILIYAGFSQPYFFWLMIIPIGVFIMMVNRQSLHKEKKQLANFLEELNRREEKNMRFEVTEFSDGNRFADPHHSYGHDLDLFGRGSVFQYINRCGTQLGEERLAHDLKNLPYQREQLLQREEAVRE